MHKKQFRQKEKPFYPKVKRQKGKNTLREGVFLLLRVFIHSSAKGSVSEIKHLLFPR
jgi:hypothetical protein